MRVVPVLAFSLCFVPLWHDVLAEPAATGSDGAASATKAAPQPGSSNVPTTNGSSSQIQVVYQPHDLVTNGEGEPQTTFAVRALSDGVAPLKLISVNLRDNDSGQYLPIEAFSLGKEASEKPIPKANLAPVSITLKNGWRRAGNYSGNVWVAAGNDSGAQSINLKVYIRPWWSWLYGPIVIACGSGMSWFALLWVARRRQLAANQILISRLQNVIDGLLLNLDRIEKAGAPQPELTIGHLQVIKEKRLRQLMDDKELSIIAGVGVPQAGTPSVIDEINGMNRIVLNGFDQLLVLWNQAGANQASLHPLFSAMDALGENAQPLDSLDSKIQAILSRSTVPAARQAVNGEFPALPSEQSVVHRVVTETYILDVLSVAVVVLTGVYVLVWKNLGFGTAGNYIECFLWGLGLKVGSDLAKLGPGDIRTAFGIKIPQ